MGVGETKSWPGWGQGTFTMVGSKYSRTCESPLDVRFAPLVVERSEKLTPRIVVCTKKGFFDFPTRLSHEKTREMGL